MTKRYIDGMPTLDVETLETFPDIEIAVPHQLIKNGEPTGLIVVPYEMWQRMKRREDATPASNIQLTQMNALRQMLATPVGKRLPKPDIE